MDRKKGLIVKMEDKTDEVVITLKYKEAEKLLIVLDRALNTSLSDSDPVTKVAIVLWNKLDQYCNS
jgi:hypothetical protein